MADLLVVNTPGATEIIEVARQGPPGPRGPAGAPGGAVLQVVAAVALGGHVAVAYDAAGLLMPASADDASHALRLVGLTTSAVLAGDAAQVQRSDVLEHAGWTFAPGAPVYLGLAGALVQTVPASALFTLVLGVALTPTRLLVAPRPAVFVA